MREIKFRAWHKTWSDEKSEDHNGINGMQGVKSLYWGNTGKLHVHLWEWADSCLAENVELMQFTGLLDKNGKDIYEGDVVKIYSQLNERITVDTIVWERDGFKVKKGGQIPSEKRIEVIGNIYENPDSIKE